MSAPVPVEDGSIFNVRAQGGRGWRFHTVTEVINKSMVSGISFSPTLPKEAAAFRHDGTYYVTSSIWDRFQYDTAVQRDVVLFSGSGPENLSQLSNVTDDQIHHASAVLVDDSDELWIFSSNSSTGHIDAFHAPASSIPSSPAGWTKVTGVISSARDPCIVNDGSIYHLWATENGGDNTIKRWTATDLTNWTIADSNVYTNTSWPATEGVDIVEKADGNGYWLTHVARDSPGNYRSIYLSLSSLTDSAPSQERFQCTTTTINGIAKPFHDQWTTHFDYCRTANSERLAFEGGDTLAYFEGGDGSDHHVGLARAANPSRSPILIDRTDPTLEGFYPMAAGSGTTAYDLSTTDLDGTITGASWVADHYGFGLDFGSGDRVVCSSSAGISGAITVAFPVIFTAWKRSGNELTYLCSGFDGSATGYQLKTRGANQILWGTFDGSSNIGVDVTDVDKIKLNTPLFLVGRYDAVNDEWSLRINGEQISTTSSTQGPISVSSRRTIGAIDQNGSFNANLSADGVIGPVFIWSEHKSDAFVDELFEKFTRA